MGPRQCHSIYQYLIYLMYVFDSCRSVHFNKNKIVLFTRTICFQPKFCFRKHFCFYVRWVDKDPETHLPCLKRIETPQFSSRRCYLWPSSNCKNLKKLLLYTVPECHIVPTSLSCDLNSTGNLGSRGVMLILLSPSEVTWPNLESKRSQETHINLTYGG